ncbi:MAG: helix-turn-helix domain-containing protein [Acidobacteriia bacterium]|nr:helix-turn-helix domain-containing protein [Terriglobia bacterium]
MKTSQLSAPGQLPLPTDAKVQSFFPTRLLSTPSALRFLHRRTGGIVSRATFYRWLNSGELRSIRLGFRIYIPLRALDEFIRKCMNGE